MTITEAPPPEANYSSVASFLDYHDNFNSGKLSLSEVLVIPRRPELLDLQVPNPEEFSQPFPILTDKVTKIAAGRFNPDTNQVSEGDFGQNELSTDVVAPYIPIIKAILEDAKSRGIDISKDEIEISLKQGTGAEEIAYIGQAHLDQKFGLKTRLIYAVADRVPTNFYAHSFDVGNETVDQALEEQSADGQIFHAEPYQVVLFDNTLPHATPPELANDQTLRTVLRVWISEPNPYLAQTAD